MKKHFLIMAIALQASLSVHNVYAKDDEPCKLLLQGGLYKTFKIVRTGDFNKDMKTYFESDQFRQDFKTNSWSLGVSVMVDASQIGLSIGSSDTEIRQFQERIRQGTHLTLQQSFYDYALTSVPDVELAEKYVDCLVRTRLYGFKLYPTVNEKDVTFQLSYTKQYERDPMPRVTRFDVIHATNIKGGVKVGDRVRNTHVITAVRDPNRDLTFIFETDKGVVTYKVPAEPTGFNKDFPVGTIILSYLNFDQFNAATQNNQNSPGGIWTSRYSRWAPADGRPVPNSKFNLITSQQNLPDLRGVFLRGLNSFDPNQPTVPFTNRVDPDTRTVGQYQDDAIENHNHPLNDPGHNHGYRNDNLSRGRRNFNGAEVTEVGDGGEKPKRGTGITIEAFGGPETRPKNVALYYYMRIN